MKIKKVGVSHYEKIESQTQRLENTQHLSELFIKMENKNLDKLVYLTQGKLHPDWMGFPEIGLSEKSIIKTIMKITGYTNSDITEKIHQEGDVGEAFYRLIDYEKEDATAGSQTFACSGDSCEIVDIGA